jgi:hypothetical protein
MTAAGSVVWTGSSSMDIRMELLQARTRLRATRSLCLPARPASVVLHERASCEVWGFGRLSFRALQTSVPACGAGSECKLGFFSG